MATNKIYVDPGAIFAFMDPNGTTPPAGATRIAFALTNLAYLSGRISAPLDRGAGALPMRYAWRLRTAWGSSPAPPANGDAVRLYIIQADAEGDGTQCDGGWALGADGNITTEAALYQQAMYLGAVLYTGGSYTSSSGICVISSRYISVAAWDTSGTAGLASGYNTHIFTLQELPDEVQAAS